jgi:predicted transcriptional regulator
MLEELNELFESSTIKPTFEYVHIILALFIFGNHPEGIGRYRLKENLLIGSGTARSLIEKLGDVSNFIKVQERNKRRGHVLTERGKKFLNKIKGKIPFLESGKIEDLREIIIQGKDVYAFISLVKNSVDKLNSDIEQRDAAIKVNGSGATCLIYDKDHLKYPSSPITEDMDVSIGEELTNYFKSIADKKKAKLEDHDVVIVGLGNTPERARLATLNSALTLIE